MLGALLQLLTGQARDKRVIVCVAFLCRLSGNNYDGNMRWYVPYLGEGGKDSWP